MLKQLYIKNFTLIDELDISFGGGFSAITGETGAGKSIILGAVSLLLGQRADSKSIKNGAERCIIEAHFDLSRYQMQEFFNTNEIDYDAEDCILRRELTAAGKSRAFINDSPVPLTTMRELGEQLVDIHSQHQNLLLRQEDFQLGVVDIITGEGNTLNDYQEAYNQYRQALKKLNDFREQLSKNHENEDLMRFQYKELDEARLVEGEQEDLEQESEVMSHAEEIKSALYETDNILCGDQQNIVGSLKTAAQKIQGIEQVYPDIDSLSQRLNSCYIELKDLSADISHLTERIDFDPVRMQTVNDRLDTIYTLEKKFHVDSVKELIDCRDHLAEQLRHIDSGEEELAEMEEQVNRLQSVCKQRATILTAKRKEAASKIEEEMCKRLIPLGIPHVRFLVQFQQKELSSDGADKVAFLFSANTSTQMQPVSQVASGGEIARVMLSLKALISGTVKLPTIIFDEIDTGVSGKIAERMAEIMSEMGNHERQVISITHLPQIAAMAKRHYVVRKEETPQGTISRMTELSADERINEIAQMLSGSNITEAAINNAKELLRHAPSL